MELAVNRRIPFYFLGFLALTSEVDMQTMIEILPTTVAGASLVGMFFAAAYILPSH